MATFFLDYENGNDNYSGTSFSLIASGTDGRTNNYTFSAATANFPNNGTIAGIKNLFGSSERYDNNNAWSGGGFSVVELSTATPPSGLYSVWQITESSATSTHYINHFQNIYSLNTSVQHTASFYLKPNGRNEVTVQFGSDSTKAARYNISTGTVVQTGANATSAISNAGGGWYRISLTATPATANDIIYLSLTNDTHNSVAQQTYTGDGVRGILVTAAQLEAASSVTSYEKPPCQYLSIFNGSIYAVYQIINYISSTSLYITAVSAGTGVAVISVDRQYYIGGRWKTMSSTGGANATRLQQGDTLRFIASPSPTSIGNATWTSGMMQSTKNIVSSTNASPISVTVTGHGYSTGDTVFITSHTTNTNANGIWEITVTGTNTFTLNNSTGNGTGGGTGTVRLRNNAVVRLPSALTQTIASTGNRGNGRTVWTASTNITTLVDSSDTKEGDIADYIGIGASFTTGKAAYKTLASTLDLSGYQQLSLWIKLASGNLNVATNDVSIVLCSDTTGDVPVNTFNIPLFRVTNKWTPFTINLGTNLGSSIRSVALYINNDRGAQVFYISNIIACKAVGSNDSLNLQSLIGKNTSGETWYGIQSIDGTRVILDNGPNTKTIDTTIRGYIGTSETVTTYKRETIKTDLSTSATAVVQALTEGHFNPTVLTYLEGGWDRTDMSTQNSETVFDGLNGFGQGIVAGNQIWGASMNKISCVRYYDGIYHHTGARFTKITNCFGNNNDSRGIFLTNQCNNNIINNVYAYSNASIGLSITSFAYEPSITNSYFKGNGFDGLQSEHNFGTIDSCVADNNGRYGFMFSFDYKKNMSNCSAAYNGAYGLFFSRSSESWVKNLTTIGNVGGSVGTDICGHHGISNSNLQEATALGTTLSFAGNKIYFHNLDQVENNHLIGLDSGSIYSSAAVARSGSAYSWALAPTSTNRYSGYPLDLKIATVAVSANNLVTIKAWFRRTNTNLIAGLRVKGGQINGVSNDITSYMTAAADTWEEISLSFTPTENGVVDVLAEAYGGTTYTAYIDSMIITQS